MPTEVIDQRTDLSTVLKMKGYRVNKTEVKAYAYSIDYLFKSNVLWIDNGVITPIHKTMLNAIDGYIKLG